MLVHWGWGEHKAVHETTGGNREEREKKERERSDG